MIAGVHGNHLLARHAAKRLSRFKTWLLLQEFCLFRSRPHRRFTSLAHRHSCFYYIHYINATLRLTTHFFFGTYLLYSLTNGYKTETYWCCLCTTGFTVCDIVLMVHSCAPSCLSKAMPANLLDQPSQLSSSRMMHCVSELLLGSLSAPATGDKAVTRGLVLLCHDASISPTACLLPGPKTIRCKLQYGLFRLMCCLRTWCDWVSIHNTTLKLPASWPQTPTVTASVHDGSSAMAWVYLGEETFPLLSDPHPLLPLWMEGITD